MCWNAVVILFINYVQFYFDAEIKSTFTSIGMIGCEHQPHTSHIGISHIEYMHIDTINRQIHTASIG